LCLLPLLEIMSGTLYGIILSPNVQRVLLVAYELGIDLKQQQIDFIGREHKQAPFLEKNPFGEIPVYESADKSVSLFESRGIAHYLDATKGGKLGKYGPTAEYGLVENWISVETFQFNKLAGLVALEGLVKPKLRGLPLDAAALETAKKNLDGLLAIYEKHLTHHEYLAGSEYTLADLFHIPIGGGVFNVVYPESLVAHPHVKKWWEKISGRPASEKVHHEVQEAFKALQAARK